MAKNDFEIKSERRLCKVVPNDEYGYFHCWEHYMEPLTPAGTMGGHK